MHFKPPSLFHNARAGYVPGSILLNHPGWNYPINQLCWDNQKKFKTEVTLLDCYKSVSLHCHCLDWLHWQAQLWSEGYEGVIIRCLFKSSHAKHRSEMSGKWYRFEEGHSMIKLYRIFVFETFWHGIFDQGGGFPMSEMDAVYLIWQRISDNNNFRCVNIFGELNYKYLHGTTRMSWFWVRKELNVSQTQPVLRNKLCF